MKIKVLEKQWRPRTEFEKHVQSYDDAYEKGYFSGSMAKDEFFRRIEKYNSQLRWFTSKFGNQLYTGIWHGRKMVASVTPLSKIPRFNLLLNTPDNPETHEKVLCKSWISVFNTLEKQGYVIDDKDISY